ncbi:MAG: DUF6804 family protein [Fusobacteriaceae bacterium]
MNFKNKDAIIISISFLVAVFNMPYWYYTIFRIIWCVYFILLFQDKDYAKLKYVMIFSIVLYNPVLKIPLNKEVWQIINILYFLFMGYLWYRKKKQIN